MLSGEVLQLPLWSTRKEMRISMAFVDQICGCVSPFQFSKAIDVAASSMHPALRRSAYRRAGGGVEVLESEDRLNDYLVAYGEMHMAKLQAFIPTIPWVEVNDVIIVDWGCGQGIASAVTLEYLRSKHPSVRVRGVRLVEKSTAARKRAEVIVSRYENSEDVRSYEWNLTALKAAGLDIPQGMTVVHMFSNILDVVISEQPVLAEIVRMTLAIGSCHMICVGPKGCSVSPISSFYGYFPTAVIRRVDDCCIAVQGKYYPYGYCSCYGISFSLSATTPAASLPEVHYYPEDLMAFSAANMPKSIIAAINYGVDVNTVGEAGETAVMLAAKYGATEALKELIDRNANVLQCNGNGASPLYFAAKYGRVDCVQMLLAAGADLESRVSTSGLTPYLVAAKYGNTECVELLIRAGCNQEAGDARGRCAEQLSECFAEKGKRHEC